MGALVWKKEAGSYTVGVKAAQPAAGAAAAVDQPPPTDVQQAPQDKPQPQRVLQRQQQQQLQSQSHKRPATTQQLASSSTPGTSPAQSPHKRPRISTAATPNQPRGGQQAAPTPAHAPAGSNHNGRVADLRAAGAASPHASVPQHMGSPKAAASTEPGAHSSTAHAAPSRHQHASTAVAGGQPPHFSPHETLASTHQNMPNRRQHPVQPPKALHQHEAPGKQQHQQQQPQLQPPQPLSQPPMQQQQQHQQQRPQPQPPRPHGPRAHGPQATAKQPHLRPAACGHKRRHGPPQHQTQQQLQAKETELEALRARIAAAEAAAAAKATAEAARAAKVERERAAERQAAEEMRQRRARLNSAFAPAFEAAAAKADTVGTSPDAAGTAPCGEAERAADDAKEVARVLAAKGDWEALGLGQGSGSTALKKRYRELAVRLHPDKCRVQDATAAFQRVHRAYQALSKFVV